MCDKENCNCESNPCCGDCEPWNCVEQAVNDVWSTKEGQIEELVERAETAAENSEASAKASADSAAEAKEFRDEAEQAATTAVAAEGIVVGVANDLQDVANSLKTALAGITVVTWYYTAVSDNQTVIPIPTDKNQVDVQAIYIEGARQEPNRGFTYDPLKGEITLAEGIPLGLEISIIIGTYSDNPNDFANTLASNNGAALIGTSSGKTLQEKLLEIISIADYLTDNDVAEAIIKATAASNGTIIIPAGHYVASPTPSQVAGVLASLSRLEIKGSLTILLPKGVVTLNSPVLVELLGGNKLSIVGQDNVPITITGQVSVVGSAGNYQVTLSVSTTEGITVGDFIHTNQAVGTGAFDIHRGVWEIIAIGSGTITVKNTCQLAAFPTNTITSSSSRVLTSVLLFNRCDAFIVPSCEVGNMSNFVIAGNSDDYWSSSAVSTTELGTHGLAIGSNTVAVNGKGDNVNPQGRTGGSVTFGQYMGVTGFDQQGIVTELGGNFWGDFTCSCNNKRRGFYASTASGIRAKQITANGNYLDGVIADIGGDIYSSSSSCAAGNGSSGVSGTQNGFISWDSGKAIYNKLNGVNVVAGGIVQITGGTLQGNVATGANLAYGAILYCDNSQIKDNGTYGINCQLSSVVRGPNCNFSGNGNQGIRGSYHATITFTGSVFSGNAGGDFIFTTQSIGINGSTNYGGDIATTDIKITNQTTNKSVRVSGTSGGDSLVISHDINGAGTFVESYHLRADNTGFIPTNDALKNVGRAANRFNVGFFAGGTQSTSDGTLKDPTREFTQAELNAAMKIAKMFGFWTWLDDAGKRLHAGTTVQAVLAVLEEEGLDWRNYGFIGFDEWENEYAPVTIELDDGVVMENGEVKLVREAGSVWQLRDQEFDRFVMRGLSERLSILESRVITE